MYAEELRRARRVVVKVGTSLVTHPNGRLHQGRLEMLVRQLSDLHAAGLEPVLVTSGAVGAGIGRLGAEGRPASLTEKQAFAAVGQGLLMHSYEKLFAEYGVTVAQILLTREDLEHPERRANARATMQLLLEWRVLPIVNENDTVTSEEIRVGDNDTLSARVAVLVDADLLIILSDVDGLFPADPRSRPDLEVLSVVEELSEELWSAAGGAGTPGGTGGMRTKLEAAAICQERGIPMVIASGHRQGVLTEILSGEVPGTLFRWPHGTARRRGG
ncbi:glutamate 5-kinase [Caldinitratiruptor microaerophilus]|uniref:Glutamate 5-kinase n=1 Tax=Caldinitratiruptor microaerophilus TaxID=671077 RepID=A0AA35CKV2_9FIRM|nr:glutamate 5-kinase [Caldinitratiruptor microaerophilus]BDG59170.1 hypothetical protein caldi_02600 [Caldinitratiruptor microaerophilus]